MTFFHKLNKDIGELVLKKYNYSCTNCGKKKDLCVHHIERKSPKDADYNVIDNLTVLCRKCHMSYHRKAGHVISVGNKKGNKFGRRGKDTLPVKCKIEGCNLTQHGRGLCKKHYEYCRRRNWDFNKLLEFINNI